MSKRAGLFVDQVMAGGIGEKAGLRKGDIITKYGDHNLLSPTDLERASEQQAQDNSVTSMSFYRDDEEVHVEVEGGELKIACSTTIFEPVVRKKPITTGENDTSSPLNLPNTGLISFLEVIAWLTLIFGTIISVLVLWNFGFAEVVSRFGRSRHFNLFGCIVAFSIFMQSVITFSLLKVISTMALEVKMIKVKIFG